MSTELTSLLREWMEKSGGLHFHPTGWSQWYELKIPVKAGSALQAISRKKGEVDLFYTALNGSLGYRQTTSEGAINMQNLGGYMLGGLSVACWGLERLRCDCTGWRSALYHLPGWPETGDIEPFWIGL